MSEYESNFHNSKHYQAVVEVSYAYKKFSSAEF